MNRWELTKEVSDKYTPIIKEYIDKMQKLTYEEIEEMKSEEFCLSLSDTGLNPYTLLQLLKNFGYGDEEFDRNGWECDFWIDIKNNSDSYPSGCEKLCIYGCGITFELNLSIREFM